MKIKTTQLTEKKMNMPTNNTLLFPNGLIGLTDFNEFKLFEPESDAPTVYELQSVKDESLTLSIVAPDALNLKYGILLNDDEQALLDVQDAEDVVVALIIYKPEDETKPMKAMVKTPLIINAKTRVAIQKTLAESDSLA
jgi:flagellar assembly factor FliW